MQSEKSPFPAGSSMTALFLLRFDRAESAECRIAGVAIAAHLAALADRAGAHDIRGVTVNNAPLADDAWDDVRRACPSGRFDGYEGTPALSVSGTTLVAAEALARFASSEAQILIWRGAPVARKTGCDGSGTLVLEDKEAVSCDDRVGAERWVLRTTEKRGDGIVSRPLNRPISQAISRRLLRIDGIRPWHM